MILSVQIVRDAAGWLVEWTEADGTDSPPRHSRPLAAAGRAKARAEAARLLGVSERTVLVSE